MSRHWRARRIVYRVLDADARDSGIERAGNLVLATLILANAVAVVLETVPSLRSRAGSFFEEFEAFSVVVFSVEYALRLWTCVEMPSFGGSLKGRLRFMLSPMALVDLAVILPAYLPGEVALDLRFARVIRLVRMMRVLKVARYSRALRTFGSVFRERRADLGLITFFLLLLLVVASSSMYFVEHTAQPQVFSSIPAAMWWAAMTLTTVGYGDIYPVTPLGKILSALIAFIGIGFFALPAGILAAAFADELAKQRERERPSRCPHCGKEIR